MYEVLNSRVCTFIIMLMECVCLRTNNIVKFIVVYLDSKFLQLMKTEEQQKSPARIAAPPPPCNPDTPCIASAQIPSQPQNSLFQISLPPTSTLL